MRLDPGLSSVNTKFKGIPRYEFSETEIIDKNTSGKRLVLT